MRANFVERILARVDGEAATIWISTLFLLRAPLDAGAVTGAVVALVRETPRLHLAWRDPPGDWRHHPRGDADARAAVRALPSPVSLRALADDAIRARIDLARDLPLRVTLAPLDDGRTALAVQVHHAIGDARSVMHLCRRFFQHLAGTTQRAAPLGPPGMTDARALALALPRAPLLASPRDRVLARRGHALRRRGDAPGAPLLASLRVRLDARWAPAAASGLFFGALLAAMVAHDGAVPEDAPLRLRVPVDLRRELGIGPTLENACSAVPIEVTAERLRSSLDNPAALAALVPDALREALARGVHHATVVECWLASRLASPAALRRHVRPDLVAARRASTLVTTYVGAIDRYVTDCPVALDAVVSQTPTWGANGLRLGDALVVNLTAFEGLWSRDDLDRFADAAGAWLSRHPGLTPERLL